MWQPTLVVFFFALSSSSKMCRWTVRTNLNTIEGRWFKVLKLYSFQTELSFIHAWVGNTLFGITWLVHLTLYSCGPLFIVIIKLVECEIWNLKFPRLMKYRYIRLHIYDCGFCNMRSDKCLSFAYLWSLFFAVCPLTQMFCIYVTLAGVLLKNF